MHAGKLTREVSIMSPMETLHSMHKKNSETLPGNKVNFVPPLIHQKTGEMTACRFHRLQSTKENEELKDISSSDGDYRSALSQALHNDFEFLQNCSNEDRVKILKSHHEKRSARGHSGASHDVSKKASDESKFVDIPNIFAKKDSILSDSQDISETNSQNQAYS